MRHPLIILNRIDIYTIGALLAARAHEIAAMEAWELAPEAEVKARGEVYVVPAGGPVGKRMN